MDHQAELPISAAGSAVEIPQRNQVDGAAQPAGPLAELCQLMRDELKQLPPKAFGSYVSFFAIRNILGLDLDLPPTTESQPPGSDSV